MRCKKTLLSISFIVILLFALDCVWPFFGFPSYIAPAPSAILQQFITDSSLLVLHSGFSLLLLFSGIILAFLWSIFLLWMISVWPPLQKTVVAVAIMGQAIPAVAIAPFLVVYFGFSLIPKIFFVAGFSFFPIFLYAYDAMKALPQEWHNLRCNLRLSCHQFFWQIQLWLILPSLLTGLRLALTYSLGTVIFVEWLGSQYGLGVFLARSMSSFATARVIMLAIVITSISFLLAHSTRCLQQKIIFWQEIK